MFTDDIRIAVGGKNMIAKNYRGEIVLEHSVSLTLARCGGEVTLDMVPTFVHALLSKVDKDIFATLSNSVKLNVLKSWIKTCRESVVYRSVAERNAEEPNIVY